MLPVELFSKRIPSKLIQIFVRIQFLVVIVLRSQFPYWKAWGEGDNRGWDGWMVSPTQWTWVWANSGSWWWTGKPGVLQSMGSQRVGHDWATELNIYWGPSLSTRGFSPFLHVSAASQSQQAWTLSQEWNVSDSPFFHILLLSAHECSLLLRAHVIQSSYDKKRKEDIGDLTNLIFVTLNLHLNITLRKRHF